MRAMYRVVGFRCVDYVSKSGSNVQGVEYYCEVPPELFARQGVEGYAVDSVFVSKRIEEDVLSLGTEFLPVFDRNGRILSLMF